VPHQLAAAAAAAEIASVETQPVHEGVSSHLCTCSISASGLSGGRTAGPSLAPAWTDAASGGGDDAECRSTAVNTAKVAMLNVDRLQSTEDKDVVVDRLDAWVTSLDARLATCAMSPMCASCTIIRKVICTRVLKHLSTWP